MPDFEWQSPLTLPQALRLLNAFPDEAVALAGGQSLLPAMALRRRRPRLLVDLNAIESLTRIDMDGGTLVVGAMVRQRTAERDPLVTRHAPLLALAAGMTGHVAVRNRGTVGGSLAQAEPGAEIPVAAAALGGRAVLEGPQGRRDVPVAELIQGPHRTALEQGELLTSIRIQIGRPAGAEALEELCLPVGGRPVACVAAVVRPDPDGVTHTARIVVSGRGHPLRVIDVRQVTDSGARQSVLAALPVPLPASGPATAGPPEDYCRRAIAELTTRAVRRALEQAVVAGTEETGVSRG